MSDLIRFYNILVSRKLIFTLRRLLTNITGGHQDDAEDRAVYKIKCSDCQATYIAEPSRNLTTRLNEHKRAILQNDDLNNNIAEHHLKPHALCITKDYRLGLYYVFNLQDRLLSTNYTSKAGLLT